MLSTLFNHRKSCQLRGCAAAVLALSLTLWFLASASAEEECATDFFSQKTCRSFDILAREDGQDFDAQERAVGTSVWKDYSGLSGSQIWYRNPFDSNWMTMASRRQEALGNRGIHGLGCLTDLFGNVVCNRTQLTAEVPQNKK